MDRYERYRQREGGVREGERGRKEGRGGETERDTHTDRQKQILNWKATFHANDLNASARWTGKFQSIKKKKKSI